jgi:thymidine kinase
MSLKLYIGCMFSGKTSELIREYTRWRKIGRKVVCINFSSDTRYGDDDFVYSHDLNKIQCLKATNLLDIPDAELTDVQVILINEGQFFKDLFDFCSKWVDLHKKDIVVCGLDGDYRRKPFGQINDLISIADEVTKLKAFCTKCNDGTPAIFTHRISECKDIVSINNDYIPVCRAHYVELNKLKPIIKESKSTDSLYGHFSCANYVI